jgi:cell fate (sporulation/competence/biofilm development) regulator YlbF (YheA/YmcA/DUF963 family)
LKGRGRRKDRAWRFRFVPDDAVLDALRQDFEVLDVDDVVAFLERYPSLLSLLGEIRAAIVKPPTAQR